MADAIFKIYIYNWATNYNAGTGMYSLVSNETEALSIPVSGPDKVWLMSPIVKSEVNKAESFDFTLDPGSEFYNAFIPLKTWIRVVYDTTTIFWGHVKTINNTNIIQKRSVHSEGVYTTLSDTPIEGIEEDFQSNTTAQEYLNEIIANHNSYCEDDFKKFTIGKISISLNKESKKRGATGWSTSLSELEKLIEENGGYVRARYNDHWKTNGNACNYLDWNKVFFRDLGAGSRPTIKLSKNLIDLSKGIESNDIFTRVIPVGHKSIETTSSTTKKKESSFVYLSGNKYIKVVDVPSMGINVEDGFRTVSDFTEAENRYGIIYKTVNFPNASTSSQLQEYCLDWIKNNYYGIVNSFSVKAIDMHMLGEFVPQIFVGDVVDVTYPEFDNDGTSHTITRKLICKAVQYNLLQPENNVYTFGVPCDAIDFEYGTKAKKKAASKAAATAEQEKVNSSGPKPKISITWEIVLGWLRYYYDTCIHQNIVPWTETRWARYRHTKNENDLLVQEEQPYFQQRDGLPYASFKSNGKFGLLHEVYAGETEDHQKVYNKELKDVYIKVHRPDGSGSIRAQVLGHYQISSGIAKEGYEHRQQGNTFTLHRNGFNYGVALTTDGHVYTFSWNAFDGFYYDYLKEGHLEELEKEQTFNTFFEIAKTNLDGSVSANDSYISAINNVSSLPEQDTPTTWKTYPYEKKDADGNPILDADGNPVIEYKTTAMIGSDEGWSAFGFIYDDKGKLVPTIKLNDTVTYTDKDGKKVTKEGFVTAQDLKLPEIDSFTTKVAAIDNAIMERAVVGELRAAVAALGGDYGEDSYEKDENGNFKKDANGKYILKTGTTFFTNSKNILGASGTYYVHEYEDPETGEIQKDLVIKDGSGLKVNKEGTELGVYDEGNLTGGIIVDKINGETNTLINGTQINIGDKNTKRVLARATEEYDQLVGTGAWTESVDEDGIKHRHLEGLSAGVQIYDEGNKVTYGLYHEGNLDGGMIVKKINNETKTTIVGDRIKIGTKGTKTVTLTDAISIDASTGYLVSNGGMWVTGNLTVAGANGTTPILRASDIRVGVSGSRAITFEARNPNENLILNYSTVAALINGVTPHIKITGPNANDEYTLWYLPVKYDSGGINNANWINCGNFKHAATLTGDWDSGGSYNASYLNIRSKYSKKILYDVAFGKGYVTGSGNMQYADIVYEKTHSGKCSNDASKSFLVDVTLNTGGPTGPGGNIIYYDVRYRKTLRVNGVPAWNGGWDDASKVVSLPKVSTPLEQNILFAYPSSKTVGSSTFRGTETIKYYLHDVDNNTVGLGIPNSMGIFTDYAEIKHGKYDAGHDYAKTIMHAKFTLGTFDDEINYAIVPYEDSTKPHDTNLKNGYMTFKLGLDSTGNLVEIHDLNDNRISPTPSLLIPYKDMTIDDHTQQNGGGYITILPCDKGQGAESFTITLQLGQLIKAGREGYRYVYANISGVGLFGSDSYNVQTTNSLKLSIQDYTTGYYYGYEQGFQDGLNWASGEDPSNCVDYNGNEYAVFEYTGSSGSTSYPYATRYKRGAGHLCGIGEAVSAYVVNDRIWVYRYSENVYWFAGGFNTVTSVRPFRNVGDTIRLYYGPYYDPRGSNTPWTYYYERP